MRLTHVLAVCFAAGLFLLGTSDPADAATHDGASTPIVAVAGLDSTSPLEVTAESGSDTVAESASDAGADAETAEAPEEESSMSIPLGLALAAFLILLNGFFVAAEFALVKVRHTQLRARADEGSRLAKLSLRITERLDPYLSATQLGITLASLGLGWLGEPAVARVLDKVLVWANLSMEETTLHAVSFVISFSLISFLHIVVGEVAPKSLALARPTRTTLFVAWPMRVVYLMFFPALVVLNASSNLLLRMIGVEPIEGHGMSVSAEELRHIAHHSTSEGTLTEAQGTLLDKVFTFSDRVAREIMVPRNRVIALDADLPFEEAIERAVANPHTRYPIYRTDLDNVIGVLHLKDLAKLMARGEAVSDLQALARDIIYVPETIPAQRLLKEFQARRLHLAIVVDEHGGTSGVITLEDTLEELVGEIQDEFDAEAEQIEEVSGGYMIDGGLLIAELTSRLDLGPVESDADTVSGFIMEQLGRIAKVGDEVALDGYRLRVAEMERMRIVRVLVRPGHIGRTTGQRPTLEGLTDAASDPDLAEPEALSSSASDSSGDEPPRDADPSDDTTTPDAADVRDEAPPHEGPPRNEPE